jgi:hypothetical protein
MSENGLRKLFRINKIKMFMKETIIDKFDKPCEVEKDN